MPEDKPLWQIEHGSEFMVPKEIDQLVDEEILDDVSWKNDTCPRFRIISSIITKVLETEQADEYEYTYIQLFVDHPDAVQRELEGKRFLSQLWLNEDIIDMLETDDLDDFILYIRCIHDIAKNGGAK